MAFTNTRFVIPMKKLFLIILCIIFTNAVRADEFVVRIFAPAPTDLSAIQYEHLDVNDEKCAIIKVRTDLRNLTFDSGKNLAKDVEFKNGEYWLYVSPREKRITIIKEGFITLHHSIAIPIRPSRVYIFEITNKEKESATTGTMIINTEPPGAFITVKELSGIKIITPATLQNYPAFPYTVTISKERYVSIDTILTIHPNEEITHLLSLSPKWGDLIITVDPLDAEVYIDDEFFGIGYQELISSESGLDIGTHKISVIKNKYYSEEQTINIIHGKNETLEFSLKPKKGFLSIEVNPATATLFVDGNKIAGLPYRDSLQVGFYEIYIENDGYLSSRKTIEVFEKQHTEIFEELSHTTTVKISSAPTQANIYLNGKYMGKTPESILLSYGQNNIVLKKPNYEDLHQSIEVTANTKKFDFDLQPEKFNVKVTSTPSGANIYVEQIYAKKTPAKLNLPYGEYRLMIEKKGYFRKRKLVRVNFDNQSFNFRLQKLKHVRVGFVRGAESWGGEITYVDGLAGITIGYFHPPKLTYSSNINHTNIYPNDYHNLSPSNATGKESNKDSLSYKIILKGQLFLNKAPTVGFSLGMAMGRIHYSDVYLADKNYENKYSGAPIRKGQYYSVAKKGIFKVSPIVGVSVRIFKYLYANAEYWFLTEKGTALFFGGGICFPINR